VLLIVESNEALMEFPVVIAVTGVDDPFALRPPSIARKSASWWSRRAVTNALTASSADAKLRWVSGAFAGAAWATASQRVAARTEHGQVVSVRIVTS
jgi:hypothetical protein